MSALVVDVETDARWITLPYDPDQDVDEWARLMAGEALRVRGADAPDADLLAQVGAVLAATAHHALAIAQHYPMVGAWVLTPEVESVTPVTIATLRPVTLGEQAVGSLDAVVELLIADERERYDEPQVDMLDTASGLAARVVQRLVDPGEGEGQRITEWLAYAWWLPHGDVGLVLSTEFADLVEGGRYRGACDDLARVVHVRIEDAA